MVDMRYDFVGRALFDMDPQLCAPVATAPSIAGRQLAGGCTGRWQRVMAATPDALPARAHRVVGLDGAARRRCHGCTGSGGARLWIDGKRKPGWTKPGVPNSTAMGTQPFGGPAC